VKRVLREAWKGLLSQVPPGKDYVLVARPGLADPAQSRGTDWIAAEIAEALGKVRT
jgi:RNase P protein component